MRPKFLFLFLTLLTLLSYNNLLAQCPKGKVICEGECGRFVDKDGDGYCDIPLSGKENPKKQEAKIPTNDSSSKEDIIDSLNNEIIVNGEDTVVEAVVMEIVNSNKIDSRKNKEIEDEEEAIESSEKLNTPKPYRLIGITSITLLAYFFTLILVRTGKMKRLYHRKLWNTILLVTFLMSCLLGFLLVIQINYHVFQSLFLLNLKLHVEFGIAMTLVAVIHIFWHLTYFKKLLRSPKTPIK
ncbi:MAG: hypothetical protein WCR29_01060 [Bacteroidales bacterium]|nr:DUF4405 domain-containing protein [Bacteroidales bacterium]